MLVDALAVDEGAVQAPEVDERPCDPGAPDFGMNAGDGVSSDDNPVRDIAPDRDDSLVAERDMRPSTSIRSSCMRGSKS